MKRFILAASALAFAALTSAPAMSDDVDLKTDKGVKKFWEEQIGSKGGDTGGGGGGGGN